MSWVEDQSDRGQKGVKGMLQDENGRMTSNRQGRLPSAPFPLLNI